MASKREQILNALKNTLTGTPAGNNVFRSRSIPISRGISACPPGHRPDRQRSTSL